MKNDTFTLGGKEFSSRFILGSGKYSMELIKAAVENAGAQIITLAAVSYTHLTLPTNSRV